MIDFKGMFMIIKSYIVKNECFIKKKKYLVNKCIFYFYLLLEHNFSYFECVTVYFLIFNFF